MQPALKPLPQSLQAPSRKFPISKNENRSHQNGPEDYYAAPITLDGCRCPHLEAYLPTFLLGSGFSSSSSKHDQEPSRNHRILTISDLHFASLYPDIASTSEQEKAEGVTKKKDMSLDGGTDKKQKTEKAKSNDNGNGNGNVNNLDKDNVPAHLRKHAFGEEEYKNNAIAIGALSDFYYPLYPGYHLERMETQKQLESLSKAVTTTTQIEEVTAETASFAKEAHGPKSKKEEPLPKSESFSPVRTMSINSSTQSNETLPKVTSIPNEAEIAPFTIPSFPIDEGSKIAPPTETSIPDVTASQPTETEPKPSPSTFSSEYDRFHKIHARIRKQRRNLLAKARDIGTNNSLSQKKKKASKKRTRTDSNTSNTIKDNSKFGSPYTSPSKVTRNGSSHDSGMFIHTEDQREKDTLIAASRVEEWLEVIRQNRLDYWSREKEIGSKCTEVSNVTSMWPGLCQDTESAAARLSCQSCDRKSLRQKRRSKPAPKDDEVMICLECSFRGCGPDLKGSSSSQHLMQHFLHSGHFLGMTCGPRGEIFCMKCGDFVYHEVLDREKERVDIQVNVGHLGWERRGKTKRSFGFGENLLDDFIVLPHGVMEDKDTKDNVSSAQPFEPSDLQDKKEERQEMGPIVRKQIPRNKGMVLWKGFRALYPNDVTNELVLAAQQSLHRWKIYHGRFNDGASASWGPQTLKFALHQQSRRYSGLEIVRPVGLYNLGNTCYMSCILQCLISLVPLQKYFLHEVRHDHNVCQLLKSTASKASNNGKHVESDKAVKCNGSDSVCLACEMDKLFLLYYGSAIGMDVISAMKEGPVTTSSSPTMELSLKNTNDVKGVPVAPSDFLQTAWQCKGMSHLAGHEQRDAHEFLQAFLDIMGKHCLNYDQTIREMKEGETDNKSRNGDEAKIDEDIISRLFKGKLRSVLVCEECGYKRSQFEPFLNISLPLKKEMITNDDSNNSNHSIGTRNAKTRINLQNCLKHFTQPEPLSDAVPCPWCEVKTRTQKQHTFAKLPQILCLHLKRFDAISNKKISDAVSFPLELNMGPHLPHWREVEQRDKAPNFNTSVESAVKDKSCPSMTYELCGTVSHHGTLNQGHYVSNVKMNEEWFHCDDAFVTRSGEEEVLKDDSVYMMFYAKK